MALSNKKYQVIYDCYYGEGGFEDNATESYLIKDVTETDEDYNRRLQSSDYSNLFQPIIDVAINRITTNPPIIETQSEDLLTFINNQFITKCNNILLFLKLYDQAYFGLNLKEGYLPTIINVNSKDITSVIIDDLNNVIELDWIQYESYSTLKIPVQCLYKYELGNEVGNITKKTLAYYDDDGKLTLEATERRATIFDTNSPALIKKYGLNNITDTPSTWTLAKSNVWLFRQQSNIDNILHKFAFPVLAISTDQQLEDINLGPSRNILVLPTHVTKMPEYIQADSTSYDTLSDNISKKVQIIMDFYGGKEIEGASANSVIGTILVNERETEAVNSTYYIYQSIVETLLDIFILFVGKSITYETIWPSLKYNLPGDEDETSEKSVAVVGNDLIKE